MLLDLRNHSTDLDLDAIDLRRRQQRPTRQWIATPNTAADNTVATGAGGAGSAQGIVQYRIVLFRCIHDHVVRCRRVLKITVHTAQDREHNAGFSLSTT